MSNLKPVEITSPVGRIVQGDLYTPNKTDSKGNPLVFKSGDKKGQPAEQFYFALAIPKNPGETHWASTTWGAKIWAAGHAAHPAAAQRHDYSWKIEDGDSTIPNKNNRVNANTEGFPGHWIIKFSSYIAPKLYQPNGQGSYEQLTQPGFIKRGHYVEVFFTVQGNTGESPGVYINPSMVCFRAYGPEIYSGPDVSQAGFGQAPLPAGASMTPPPSNVPMPASAPAMAPAAPAMSPPVPGATMAPPPVPVTPNHQFLQVPVPGGAPAAPLPPAGAVAAPAPMSAPPAPPAPTVMTASPSKMTAKAGGQPREAFVGWSDAQLIEHGYMMP